MSRSIIHILIPETASGHTMAVVRCLKKFAEIKLHGCSRDPNSPFRYSIHKESFTFLKEEGELAYIKDLLTLIESKSIDVVLPIDEDTYKFFAAHKATFQEKTRLAPLSDEGILTIATNKYQLAKFCELHEIPAPKTTYLDDFTEKIKGNQDQFSYPVILKPETGCGGKNVYQISDGNELKSIKPPLNPNEGKYIIQEYIDGYDIDMSLLARDGRILAHTIQKGFMKRGNKYAAAAGVQFQENETLYKEVEKLVKKLNFSGIAHVDLRYDQKNDDYKIIEINARYWGSLIASYLSGINFPYLHVLTALGYDIPPVSAQPIRYLDFVSAVKMRRNIFSLKRSSGLHWKDTDLRFILNDPIAEIYNAWKRRIR